VEGEVIAMKTLVTGVILAGVLLVVGCSQPQQESSSAGPNGGDVVFLKGGPAYAEVVANADTGEVLLTTWDKDLKTRRPLDRKPITIGAGEQNLELMPHPTDTDPAGKSSRFYGKADWIRGGTARNGWMHGQATGGHTEFEWRLCWKAGKAHGHLWEEMGKHQHMDPSHEHGEHGRVPKP
jgi:hypothetical protein